MHADARRCSGAAGSLGAISGAGKKYFDLRQFRQPEIQKNIIPAHLMIDSPAAPDRHGGRRPAIHAYAARSKIIVDAGLRRHDAEGGGHASIIMLSGIIPAHLMIDSPAAPDRHGGRRPAIHAYAARSKKIVDAGLRRHDAESGSRASIIMLSGIIPARLMIDSPAAPDRHGGRRPAIHAYAARSKQIVDAGLRRRDTEGGGRASIIMLPGIKPRNFQNINYSLSGLCGFIFLCDLCVKMLSSPPTPQLCRNHPRTAARCPHPHPNAIAPP